MAKYRTKPLVVEAVQLTDKMRTGIENLPNNVYRDIGGGGLSVVTRKVTIGVEVGDWIITDLWGEIYSCKPNKFKATYEKED